MPKQSASLEDVARAAGVHRATASRALQGDPRISAPTRQRVEEAAKQLGYQPNALVSLLMSHRRAVTTPKFQAVIAYVTRFGAIGAWRPVSESFVRIFRGACDAAERQGYRIEEFCYDPGQQNAEEFSRMLHARGIQCVLFAPLPRPSGHARLDWPRFVPVTIGYSIAKPEMHRVSTDHFGVLVRATREIRRRGFRKIGLLLTGWVNQRTDRRWLGAQLVEDQRAAPEDRIPPLETRDWDEAAFCQWYRKHRPEVILGVHVYRVLEALQRMKVRVPEDVGVVSLELREREAGCTGIDQSSEQIGAAAVHTLIGMLHRGERGLPPIAQKILIDGVWVEGSTLGKVRQSKKRSKETRPSRAKTRSR